MLQWWGRALGHGARTAMKRPPLPPLAEPSRRAGAGRKTGRLTAMASVLSCSSSSSLAASVFTVSGASSSSWFALASRWLMLGAAWEQGRLYCAAGAPLARGAVNDGLLLLLGRMEVV